MVNNTNRLDDEFSVVEAARPLQLYGARRGVGANESLLRLMNAMLIDAVRCFQTKFGSRQQTRRQEFAEVWSWIFSGDDKRTFSFKEVCDALELDPKAVRKQLVGWVEKRLSDQSRRMMIRALSGAEHQRIS
jgi:hypothetical protein